MDQRLFITCTPHAVSATKPCGVLLLCCAGVPWAGWCPLRSNPWRHVLLVPG